MAKLEKPDDSILSKYNIDYSLFENELLELARLQNKEINYNLNQSNNQFIKLADATNGIHKSFLDFYIHNKIEGNVLRLKLDNLILLIKDIQRHILLTEIGRKELGFDN